MLNRKINILLIALLMTKGLLLMGQKLNMPSEGFRNSFGVSISGGVFLDKEAVFIGASTDYSRLLGGNWIVNVSFCYDQEHSSSEDGSTAIVNTLSPALALGYAISPRLAAGIGIGKGMFDDDNSTGTIKYTSEGNLSVGLLCVYTLYKKGPHSIDIGGGIERGLITPETDITIELGYGINF
jgi:hypothetical protein